MEKLKSKLLAGFVGLAVLTGLAQGADSQKPAAAKKPAVATAAAGSHVTLGGVPLAFEPNRGQAASGVNFYARGDNYSVALTENAAILRANGSGEKVRMRFVGGASAPKQEALQEQSYKTNYFIGSDPTKWHRGIANYGRVRFDNIYPGISADFYGQRRSLEYDLTVQPGVDPKQIRLAFDGANDIRINETGDLVLNGAIINRKPVIYQKRDGSTNRLDGRYLLNGNEVTFEIAKYDATLPLVIDPLIQVATYVGGSAADDIRADAVDDPATANCGISCGLYVAGTTTSPSDTSWTLGSAVTVPSTTIRNNSTDAFAAKLTLTGDNFFYISIFGGDGDDVAKGIAVRSGLAYVVGTTQSPNFPLVGAFQPIFERGTPSPGSTKDAFIVVLNAAGSAISNSSYIGGGDDEEGNGIAMDPATGNAYIVGQTKSADLLKGVGGNVGGAAFQPTINGNNTGGVNWDAFVVRVTPGFVADYGTYFGGRGDDFGDAIAVDSTGFYITGQTFSNSATVGGGAQFFPIVPGAFPYQGTLSGNSDAFVAKIAPTAATVGAQLVYSTYVGGAADDAGTAIAVDAAGQAWMAGWNVNSGACIVSGPWPGGRIGTNNFFSPGSANPNDAGTSYNQEGACLIGQQSGLAVKLNAAGTRVLQTYLKGANTATVQYTGVALDSDAQVYLSGIIANLAATADVLPQSNNALAATANIGAGSTAPIVNATGQQGFFERLIVAFSLFTDFETYTNSGAGKNQRSNAVAVINSKRDAYIAGTTDAAVASTNPAYIPSQIPAPGNVFASADFTFAGTAITSASWSGLSAEGYVYDVNFNDAVATSPAITAGNLVFNLAQAVTSQPAADNATVTLTFSDPGFGSVGLPTFASFSVSGINGSVTPATLVGAAGTPGIFCSQAGGGLTCNVKLNTNPATSTDFTGLVPGQYRGFLRLGGIPGDDTTGVIPVIINIVAPALRTVPSSLSFTTLPGGPTVSQTVDVQVTPPPAPAVAVDIPFTATVAPSGPFTPYPATIIVSISGQTGTTAGAPNFTLNVTASANAVPGTYSGTVTITPPAAQVPFNNAGTTLPFTIVVTSPGIPPFANIGVFRTAGLYSAWILDRNSNYQFDPGIDTTHFFGLPGDIPVVGDWTGNGVVRMGIFRCPAVGAGICAWYVDLNNNGKFDAGDAVWFYGLPGDVPVVGDWTGVGTSNIGVVRCPAVGTPGLCLWFLDINNNHAFDFGDLQTSYGVAGDVPVVGRWNTLSIADEIGVFRCPAAPSSFCTWIVDSNADGIWEPSDNTFLFGVTGDKPVVGDWNDFGFNPTGRKRIGIFRSAGGLGFWIVDSNGNNSYDLTDQIFQFGLPGDTPVTGFWPQTDAISPIGVNTGP